MLSNLDHRELSKARKILLEAADELYHLITEMTKDVISYQDTEEELERKLALRSGKKLLNPLR